MHTATSSSTAAPAMHTATTSSTAAPAAMCRTGQTDRNQTQDCYNRQYLEESPDYHDCPHWLIATALRDWPHLLYTVSAHRASAKLGQLHCLTSCTRCARCNRQSLARNLQKTLGRGTCLQFSSSDLQFASGLSTSSAALALSQCPSVPCQPASGINSCAA